MFSNFLFLLKFQQVLEIRSSLSTMYLTLKGVGVCPIVSISVDDGLFDMGNVMTGDSKQDTFKVCKTRSLSLSIIVSKSIIDLKLSL